MVRNELNVSELQLYNGLKKSGKSDEFIFNKLFPSKLKERRKVLIELDKLTKKQLIYLIMSHLDLTLPSLKNMSAKDLRLLFLKVE